METPVGADYAWLACDAEGHVARFTTAGMGPVPAAVLAVRELADRADVLISGLPMIGRYDMKINLPDPSDFGRLACRGLFGYDWQDAHRTTRHTGHYEIVSVPRRAMRVEELPQELRQLAELVRLGGLCFAINSSIHIQSFLPASQFQ